MPKLFQLPKVIPLDTGGDLLAGAQLTFYERGTTNLQNVYSDPELTSPHTNPVVADGNGVFAPIYLDPSLNYKVELADSDDVALAGYPVNDIAMRDEAGNIQITDADGNFTGPDLETVLQEIARKTGIGEQIKHKTADTSRASTTTLADDDHLAGFVINADTWYGFEMQLPYNFNVGDIQFRPNYSQTEQESNWSFYAIDQAGNIVADNNSSAMSSTVLTITGLTDTSPSVIVARGVFRSHATLAGTLALEWAQNTSSANNTTVEQGSIMRVFEIGPP